jgi:probable HAF family extracellular repeat protein
VSKWKVIISASVALSFAANAKQNYVQVSIPIPAGHVAEPVALNEQGQALVTHCEQWLPAQCAAILWTEKKGAVAILSYMSGAASSFKLNDWGQVAAVRTVAPPAQTVAVWSPWDGWRDIAKFPQGGVSITAINNLGVVLGQTAQGAFLATRASGAQFIQALGGSAALAGLNDFGVVTGTLDVPCPPNTCLGARKHAFRWTPWGGVQDLETRPLSLLPDSIGLAVNRSGDVAGVLYASGYQHPFLWTDRTGVRDLGPAPGRVSGFAVLNDRRELIGWWIVGLSGIRSYLWTEKTGIVDIGTMGGVQTYARDINNKGQVAGDSTLQSLGPSHAFVWSDAAGFTDLGPGSAVKINDDGLILGRGGATGVCVWTR